MHPHIAAAAQAVRNLAASIEFRSMSARQAHDEWRMALVSRGWSAGELDEAAKTHPYLIAFEKLPSGQSDHALAYLEQADAVENARDIAAGGSDQEVPR